MTGRRISFESLKEIDNTDEIIYNIAIKYMSKKEPSSENFIKLNRFLASRGFGFEDIKHVINKLKKDGESEDVGWD